MNLSDFSFTFYQNSLPNIISFFLLQISQSFLFYFIIRLLIPKEECNGLVMLDTFSHSTDSGFLVLSLSFCYIGLGTR